MPRPNAVEYRILVTNDGPSGPTLDAGIGSEDTRQLLRSPSDYPI